MNFLNKNFTNIKHKEELIKFLWVKLSITCDVGQMKIA